MRGSASIERGSSPPGDDSKNILVVGLGNELLRDDGVGLHALRQLALEPPFGVRLEEVGTAVLDALPLFEWADAVLALDAVQAGHPPGTIYRMTADEVAVSRSTTSLHELGLLQAFRLLSPEDRPALLILGVEPAEIDFGTTLTPPVEAALPGLIRTLREILDSDPLFQA